MAALWSTFFTPTCLQWYPCFKHMIKPIVPMWHSDVATRGSERSTQKVCGRQRNVRTRTFWAPTRYNNCGADSLFPHVGSSKFTLKSTQCADNTVWYCRAGATPRYLTPKMHHPTPIKWKMVSMMI
eukprot:scaffold1400_cov175-Amphora_coffeaeformis.AAC.1